MRGVNLAPKGHIDPLYAKEEYRVPCVAEYISNAVGISAAYIDG